ncbi:MAG: hypothetical protein ACI9R3_003014 [Verrucomicrobiales bacterium]|jgi:hypothetical protein
MPILRTFRKCRSCTIALISALTLQAVVATGQELSIADQLAKLTATHQEKVDAFHKEYRAAETKEDRSRISNSFPDAAEVAESMLALVSDQPESEDAATAARWALRNVRTAPSDAVISILKEQAKSDAFHELALSCLYGQTEEIAAILDQAIVENPSNKAKAAAAFARATSMGRSAGADESENNKRREYLDLAVKQGGDLQYGKRTVSDSAAAIIFEVENLAIGKTAPDIKGEDIDGVEFALSDYRGKVVVIDFWGDW